MKLDVLFCPLTEKTFQQINEKVSFIINRLTINEFVLTPLWYPQILSNFIFSSYLPILKSSTVQLGWLKFELCHPCLRGIPSFCYSQIMSNFIFSSYFPILKILYV